MRGKQRRSGPAKVEHKPIRIAPWAVTASVIALAFTAVVLSACAEIMEPVQGLGDALRGIFESFAR